MADNDTFYLGKFFSHTITACNNRTYKRYRIVIYGCRIVLQGNFLISTVVDYNRKHLLDWSQQSNYIKQIYLGKQQTINTYLLQHDECYKIVILKHSRAISKLIVPLAAMILEAEEQKYNDCFTIGLAVTLQYTNVLPKNSLKCTLNC